MSLLKKVFRSRPAKIEVFKGANNKWYFHVRATNGKITSASQGYSTKGNAQRAAKRQFPDLEILKK